MKCRRTALPNNPGTADWIQLGHIILVSAAIRIRNSSGEYTGFRRSEAWQGYSLRETARM